MHDTDKVEGTGLVFSVGPPLANFSADALGGTHFFLVFLDPHFFFSY